MPGWTRCVRARVLALRQRCRARGCLLGHAPHAGGGGMSSFTVLHFLHPLLAPHMLRAPA
jgi:hypothetical protein